ncbi:protein-L-isoaspartate O-methyltransferase [Roseomonas sp. OT10]|uniref:protein-L-isoaspartate O-methyltransferase family protein n=1 Tax=Roseomonas cutis TaxID=2897332 RepID=UPI001E36387A|nr:protein-L-isoaspartate O-methyltransferase [Roseomonas sp. OT10]UFN51005.1 protein-L-isoaspartate O-methyltransferase [Roseomonas sp. OT10]
MDTAQARRYMVDGQLRPNKVTDPRLIDAMLRLPRERFVPRAQAARAYADADLPLGDGRVMIQPMMQARLLQLGTPRPGDRVLVVGAGTGYAAALLAELGTHVVALEESAALLAAARDSLAASAPAVQLVQGPLPAGWPAGAPYDLILVEGAVEQIPEALAGQLAEGGRLVAVTVPPGRAGTAVIGRHAGGSFSTVEAFDCHTATLPGFAPRQGFVFA